LKAGWVVRRSPGAEEGPPSPLLVSRLFELKIHRKLMQTGSERAKFLSGVQTAVILPLAACSFLVFSWTGLIAPLKLMPLAVSSYILKLRRHQPFVPWAKFIQDMP